MKTELFNVKSQTDKLEVSYLLDNPYFIDFCNKWGIEGMPSDKIRLAIAAYHDSHVSYKKMYSVLTSEEQIDEWVKGNPVHNYNRFTYIVNEQDEVVGYEPIKGGECCPDFSCCGEPIVSEQERIDFKNANDDKRQLMCMNFLSQMLAKNKPITFKEKMINKFKSYCFWLNKFF